jgi:hypothetical protein
MSVKHRSGLGLEDRPLRVTLGERDTIEHDDGVRVGAYRATASDVLRR